MKSDVFTITLLFVTSLVNIINGKTSFVKDQSTDFVFPPVDQQIIAGIPEGHLRPLGNMIIILYSFKCFIILFQTFGLLYYTLIHVY